jgi:hypothetical protein
LRTTEFWVAVTTWLLPILTLIFHENLSNLAVPLATLAAGFANGAYAISRSIVKSGHAAAVATAGTNASPAASSHLDLTELTTWVSTMAGAVQALTTALSTTAAPPPGASTRHDEPTSTDQPAPTG